MEEVKEIAECSICIDLFRDPRMLPCIHSFCLKCLNETSMKSKLKAGDSMPCPLCRTPFVIPKEGIVGLKKNFFLERLVEVAIMSKPSEKQKLCDICIEDSEEGSTEIPAATQFCIQCEKNICERCCREHRRHLKDHQLVPFDSPLMELSRKKSAMQFCDQHTKKELEMFCTNCKQAICVICYAEEHNSHKCSGIGKAADQFREEINEELKEVSKLYSGVFRKYEKINDEQKRLFENLRNIEEAIIKRTDELKEMIDSCTKSLLDELSSIKQKEVKRLEIEKEEGERYKATMESLTSYSNQLISKGSPVEICLNVSDLRSRNDDVQRLVCQHILKDLVSTEISFQSSGLHGYLKTENIVGILKVKSMMMEKDKAIENKNCPNPVAIRSTNRLGLMDNSRVRGVTKLQNQLYVLTSDPNQILVFGDQKLFKLQKRIEIKKIGEPENIKSSERLISLFIFDCELRCVWKTTTDKNRIVMWLSNVDKLFNTSPAFDDQLLVLREVGSSNQLVIYGPDGNLVRCLQLPSDIVDPWCCIQKQNGEFIISNKNGQSGHWTISQLSSDGQRIIRQITSENSIYCPSLFLDSENNLLFAADYYNHRIVLFDSNSLELKQILLTKQEHEISQPFKLFYDSKNMQLFVSNRSDSKFLNIYELCLTGTI